MRFQQKASEIRYISKRAYLHLVKVLEKCEEYTAEHIAPRVEFYFYVLSSFSFVAQVRNSLTSYIYLNGISSIKSLEKIIAKSATEHRVGCFYQKHPFNWNQVIYKFTPSCDQKECISTTDPRVECFHQSNCFYIISQVDQNSAPKSSSKLFTMELFQRCPSKTIWVREAFKNVLADFVR